MIAGCAGNITFAGGVGGCGVDAHSVHASRGTPGDMGGKATIRCTVEVADVRLEVRLEQQRESTWAPVADNLALPGGYGPAVGVLPANKRRRARSSSRARRGPTGSPRAGAPR
ncbi:hypothetical protein [Saccharothrix yanglingensis]|nr:hypothetical protein [Saccharothrix yanglingensis]